MMKNYKINELEGFNKIFDKENISEDIRKEVLKDMNLLNITVTIEDRTQGGYYEFIYDSEGNMLRRDTFNHYQKSLINQCFSHFIGIRKNISEHIEII